VNAEEKRAYNREAQHRHRHGPALDPQVQRLDQALAGVAPLIGMAALACLRNRPDAAAKVREALNSVSLVREMLAAQVDNDPAANAAIERAAALRKYKAQKQREYRALHGRASRAKASAA